jgi:hypothetical protein
MNRELLLKVADTIEKHPDNFDMGQWYRHSAWRKQHYGCGTVACIAGWTVICAYGQDKVMFTDSFVRVKDVDSGAGTGISAPVPNVAQQLLGLTDEQADELFYVPRWPEEYCDRGDLSRAVVHKTAVQYLRDLAAQAEPEIQYRTETKEEEPELVGV